MVYYSVKPQVQMFYVLVNINYMNIYYILRRLLT